MDKVFEKHGMLDLETMDTTETAHILSIGFVIWTPDNIVYNKDVDEINYQAKFHAVVPNEYNKGRSISADTVKWWMQQSEQARCVFNAVYDSFNGNMQPLFNIVNMIESVDHIWANDPDFDCVILKNWLAQHCPHVRWPFWKHRSIRTLKAMYDIPEIPMKGTAHNALDDCLYQCEIVNAVYSGRAKAKFSCTRE